MPMRVVKVTSRWNLEKTAMSVLYHHVVVLKNRIAKKWLRLGWAVSLADAQFVNGAVPDGLQQAEIDDVR